MGASFRRGLAFYRDGVNHPRAAGDHSFGYGGSHQLENDTTHKWRAPAAEIPATSWALGLCSGGAKSIPSFRKARLRFGVPASLTAAIPFRGFDRRTSGASRSRAVTNFGESRSILSPIDVPALDLVSSTCIPLLSNAAWILTGKRSDCFQSQPDETHGFYASPRKVWL